MNVSIDKAETDEVGNEAVRYSSFNNDDIEIDGANAIPPNNKVHADDDIIYAAPVGHPENGNVSVSTDQATALSACALKAGLSSNTESSVALKDCSRNEISALLEVSSVGSSARSSLTLKTSQFIDFCAQLAIMQQAIGSYIFSDLTQYGVTDDESRNHQRSLVSADQNPQSEQEKQDSREFMNQMDTARKCEHNLKEFLDHPVPSLRQNDVIVRPCIVALQTQQRLYNSSCLNSIHHMKLWSNIPANLQRFYVSSMPCYDAFAKEYCSEVM